MTEAQFAQLMSDIKWLTNCVHFLIGWVVWNGIMDAVRRRS
mgnify:CR=1 FL=1